MNSKELYDRVEELREQYLVTDVRGEESARLLFDSAKECGELFRGMSGFSRISEEFKVAVSTHREILEEIILWHSTWGWDVPTRHRYYTR